MKKAFITGITGQDGSYLAELLLEKGYEVHAIIRRASTFVTERIDHLMTNPNIFNKTLFIYYGDLTDTSCLNNLISKIQPDEIYNLAAQSHVKVSFEIPEYTSDVNANGCLHLLEAIRTHCPKCKYYQASTSEMFGGQPEEMPEAGFSETTPFHPRSPYGVAKLYAYWMTKHYREAYGLFTANGILFNHESPRRGKTFVTRKVTRWFAKYLIDNKNTQPLELGNLHAYRDWGHAKDYVNAMWLMLQHDKPDDYVISMGETHSIKDFINVCFKLNDINITWQGDGENEVAIHDGSVIIMINPKYFRPSEVDYLLGDNTKAKQLLSWVPEYTFEELVKDMIQHDCNEQWREA